MTTPSLSLSEQAELARVLEEHRRRLLEMLERRIDPALRRRLDAEDVVQHVFLRAAHKWKAYRDRGGPRPYVWLYQLARDAYLEMWRKENRARRNPRKEMPWPEQSSAQLANGLVAPLLSPSQKKIGEEKRQRLLAVLAELRPADRELLWMRHFEDLSFRDIGDVLEITETAATLRYARALDRLRNLVRQLRLDEELRP